MRIYSSITLLSLLTISLAANPQVIGDHSTVRLKSATANNLPSLVQTGDAGPKSPARGERRRDFFQAEKTQAPLISHRGSGRRQFSWA
ncbi:MULTISPECIES: heterocyst-inhibiting protein PatX [unclassified Coleofasciculus]|uniref:heterocyst-inhibiting protein PatX n=1 Tax=unclassified Coleofasciculus TaxID=2692782 RepID=UPI00187FE469|nr:MULTISPECIES: hypothetical protein [unclassified Coleofasciculus]MBE9126200.1 hypothetical protein [Coleofasciculus sp. LEGE 07081]MBE9149593.1 hypothetical protein [Coleofasciculus sp. LEGE 07092]